MPASRPMAVSDWDRVARAYFDEVVSPLRSGIPVPLTRALATVPNAHKKVAGDLGCGVGTLLPTLAERFGQVMAVDFSPAMLARARTTCRQAHVTLVRDDLANLRRLHRRLDVAITVNSVLSPDPKTLDRIFRELASTLRPGGILLGVFPAMEAVLYHGLLIHERERSAHDHVRARTRTSRILERAKYDFVHGTYTEQGQMQ